MKMTMRLAGAAAILFAFDAAASGPPFTRNTAPHPGARIPLDARAPAGTGLAPTTWGFVSHYSGSLYGTGYYDFHVGSTYAGQNSIYGYTFNYPSYGFVAEIRAVYAFDVSSLAATRGPIWSAFMFDTRETPAVGSSGISVFGGIQLVSTGDTHHLQGLALFLGNNAANLDIYDAEDFENDDPFANPENGFLGPNNTLIGAAPVTTGKVVPIDFDVSAAVRNDLPAVPQVNPLEVPALGGWGLAALGLLLGGVGAILLRR